MTEEMLAAGVDALKANFPNFTYESAARECYLAMKAAEPLQQGVGEIMLHMAAASREQEMWERRFRVLYHSHPSWRSADNEGPWGLRDFLRYAGEVCGFDDPLTAIGSQSIEGERG